MKLRRDMWWVRWVFRSQGYVPSHTSLCRLFWRTVLMFTFAPVLLAVVIGPAYIFSPIVLFVGGVIGKEWDEYDIPPGLMFVARAGERCRIIRNREPRPLRASTLWGVLVSGMRTLKSHACPIVQFIDPDEMSR